MRLAPEGKALAVAILLTGYATALCLLCIRIEQHVLSHESKAQTSHHEISPTAVQH